MATMTQLSLTLDPMGISHFHLFVKFNRDSKNNRLFQSKSLGLSPAIQQGSTVLALRIIDLKQEKKVNFIRV
jgi:hypothetical protein